MPKNVVTGSGGNSNANIEQLLKQFGIDLVRDLGDSLPDGSNASGKLRESIRYTLDIGATSFLFELRLEDYYKYVDKGRPPGKMPPEAPILRWLGFKRIGAAIQSRRALTVSPANMGNLGSRRTGVPDRVRASKRKMPADKWNKLNRRQKAYIIRRKIAQLGTEPTHFYSNVVTPTLLNNLEEELAKSLGKDVEIQIKQILD